MYSKFDIQINTCLNIEVCNKFCVPANTNTLEPDSHQVVADRQSVIYYFACTKRGVHILKVRKLWLHALKEDNSHLSICGFLHNYKILNMMICSSPQFTALLRLPGSMPTKEKKKRVDEIIDNLDMRKCLNTSEFCVPVISPNKHL